MFRFFTTVSNEINSVFGTYHIKVEQIKVRDASLGMSKKLNNMKEVWNTGYGFIISCIQINKKSPNVYNSLNILQILDK